MLLKSGVLLQVTYEQHYAADVAMKQLLDTSYESVKGMLERNRTALDELVEQLINKTDAEGQSALLLTGVQVSAIVEQHGNELDLQRRRLERAVFM